MHLTLSGKDLYFVTFPRENATAEVQLSESDHTIDPKNEDRWCFPEELAHWYTTSVRKVSRSGANGKKDASKKANNGAARDAEKRKAKETEKAVNAGDVVLPLATSVAFFLISSSLLKHLEHLEQMMRWS